MNSTHGYGGLTVFVYLWVQAVSGLSFSSVQSLSHVQLFVTPWTAARQASLSITNSRSLPKLMSIESVMPSNHLILCCLLLLLLSVFPNIRVFSNESALRIRWPKYWSFSFNISPPSEHPGLISFRMDWSLVCHESFVYGICCCSDVFNLHAVKSVSFFLYAFLSIVSSPWQDCGNTIIFFLPIQEHGISFHLFVCLWFFFISDLYFLQYRSFVSLGRFIPRYFILFDAMVNEIVYWISFSVSILKCNRFICIRFL